MLQKAKSKIQSRVAKALRKLRPEAARTPVDPGKERALIQQTEDLNRKAEIYWQEMDRNEIPRRELLNKPFSDRAECAQTLYKLGLTLAEARLGVGHTVVDFGAGNCWLASSLNKLKCRTIALDVSPTALRMGEELFRLDPRHDWNLKPQFLPYDGHHVPLPSESVDRVISFEAFHHIPNQYEILGEIYRILKPGGRAVFSEPGEAHGESPNSKLEMEKYGVLENDIVLPDLMAKAQRIGFSEVFVKPYPHPSAITFTASEYLRFMQGESQLYPVGTVQNHLRDFLVFALRKGEEVFDSRAPNVLKAALQMVGGQMELRGKCGARLALPVTLKNIGDTLWLCDYDAYGGYVALGGHLYGPEHEALSFDFFHSLLPQVVKPSESLDLSVEFTLPQSPGLYFLELDMVAEQVIWFKQAGSETVEVRLLAE